MSTDLLQPQWSDLVAALCDETITDAEFSELEQLLATDSAALRTYLRYVDLHACLPRLVEGTDRNTVGLADDEGTLRSRRPNGMSGLGLAPLDECDLLDALVAASTGPELTDVLRVDASSVDQSSVSKEDSTPTVLPAPISLLPSAASRAFTPFGSRSVFLGGAVLLTTFCFWAILAFLVVPRWQASRSGHDFTALTASIGRVTSNDNCRWGISDMATDPGSRLSPGRLRLTQGTAEIALGDGVSAVMEGPAVLDLSSAKKVYLHRGRMHVKVTPLGVGFTVNTPTATVVDLGTEFEVEVGESGATGVEVRRGSVEVAPSSRASTSANTTKNRVRLSAGETVRADAKGLDIVVTAPQGAPQGLSAKTTRQQATGSASVRGNTSSATDYVDLADIIAGGDGRGHRRDLGIDPVSGLVLHRSTTDLSRFGSFGATGKYCRTIERFMIDGVAVPSPANAPTQLDSAGHLFAGFPRTTGNAYGPVWAGCVPLRTAQARSFGTFSTSFDGTVDYGVAPHNCIALIPNKLVTFDLKAIRHSHAKKSLRDFRTVVGVTKTSQRGFVKPEPADVWVFVDGKLCASRRAIDPSHGPEEVVIPLSDDAKHLTLATTASGERIHVAWVMFGDPRIEFESSVQTSVSQSNSTGK